MSASASARRPLPAICAAISAAVCAALCAALSLPACRTSTPRAESGAARVVPLADLPPAQREVWEAWRKGAAHYELVRARVDRDPALARFVVDNLVREMVRAYEQNAFARPGGEPGRFERAQADLVSLAPYSVPVLAELLRAPDGVVAFLAADRLAAIGAESAAPVATLLDDERRDTRRRAAELLGRLPHAGAGEIAVQTALAARVEADAEWPVRAEAARALGARGGRHDHKGYALGVLLRALRDADRTVAIQAAEGLGLLAEPRAIPRLAAELEPAAARGEPGLVAALERALERLAGDGRRRTPAQWRAWESGGG